MCTNDVSSRRYRVRAHASIHETSVNVYKYFGKLMFNQKCMQWKIPVYSTILTTGEGAFRSNFNK